MRWRAAICIVVASAFGIAFDAPIAGAPHSAAILASTGQPATIQVSRDALRVEHARARTTFSTCIVAGARWLAGIERRGQIFAERPRPRRFDPVAVKAGRSPPPSFS